MCKMPKKIISTEKGFAEIEKEKRAKTKRIDIVFNLIIIIVPLVLIISYFFVDYPFLMWLDDFFGNNEFSRGFSVLMASMITLMIGQIILSLYMPTAQLILFSS